jgi:hypothetical protein
MLLEHRGEVDHSLNAAVSRPQSERCSEETSRRVGRHRQGPGCIETLRRPGYRLKDKGPGHIARLVHTSSKTHLWMKPYERTMSGCLWVQTDVASEIARSLTMEFHTSQRNFAATGTVL